MKGEAMLRQAAPTWSDQRRRAYGDPTASMAAIAARWSLTLGRPVTPAQVVLCLIDLKLARLGHDPAHADWVLDVIGYAAVLAGGAVMNGMRFTPPRLRRPAALLRTRSSGRAGGNRAFWPSRSTTSG